MGDNFLARPEIRGDRKQAAILCLRNDGLGERVGLYVSATKAINRLFWVANQEQRPRPQDGAAPSLGLRVRGYAKNDFRLHRVSVLEFIDQ